MFQIYNTNITYNMHMSMCVYKIFIIGRYGNHDYSLVTNSS